MTDPSTDQWIFIAIIATVSTARIVRLLTWDTMPFFMWFRMKWDEWTGGSTWNKLMHCQYCAGVWVAPAVLLPGYLSDWHVVWWLFHGSLALAYAGAILMAFDGED